MREKKIPIYKRIAAFVFAFILAFNCMEPRSLNIMAEEGENYNVTINWRTDDNSAVSSTPGKKAIDTDVNGEVENIFMGIQVSNSNADPKLYPGELTITLNNLDGLKRGDSEYKFVTDDPVFTSVWDLVGVKTDNVTGEIEYTITNKNIIEKDMRSTLHWTVGARDAVGYDESTASGGYEKTIQANYVINRYSRDDDGNFVTNDAFKYALVYDAGGDYVATGDMSDINKTFYAKDPDGYFVDETGGIIKDDRVAVGNAFAGTGSTEGSVIYVDAQGNSVNDETEARPIDGSGNLLNLKYDEGTNDYVLTDVDGTPLDPSTEGYDTLLAGEKTKLVSVGLKTPVKKEYHSSDFCAYSSPENGVNTNSIDFSMNTTIDTITNDLEYVDDPDAGDALPSGYVYRKFKIDLKQTKKARGIDQSSLFVAIEPTEGLTAENLTNGKTIIYDANNNPTTIVSEEINGKTYYGFYCFQDASGDINSYKTQFTIGIKEDLVTAAAGREIDVAVRDIYIAKFNDETEERYYIGYKDSEMQTNLSVLPTPSDETDFTANGAERTFYAGGIGLTKSSSFEESNHSKPSSDNKKLLSGLVFGSQTVNFDMNVSVNKTDVTSLTPDSLLRAFSVEPSFEVAAQSSPPEKLTQPYDLIVGDDTTAARYEISGVDKSYILKPGVDYRFTSVTIPSGIYKYNEVDGQQVKTGYQYEIYTADVNADGTLNWGTTPALSGETDPNSSIEKSIYAAAFYIKIKDLDVALSNKKFSAKANFSLYPMNEDYQFFMGTDADSFESSNARLVNYNFMQVLVNKNNTAGGEKNMDLASVTDPFSRLDTSGYADYRSALDTDFTTQNKDRYFIDKTGTAGYLRRAYSNVYLRTAVTRLGSTTKYTNSEYTLSAQEALKKPRRWNNSLTTTGTLQSENPGALKTFSLYVELPNKVELTDSSGNINKDALQSIFDKMTFSATDYISSIVPGQSARTLSKSDLRLGDNTFLDFDEANNRIIVRFDFTENPILASDLTRVTLNYDVLYIQDDSKENAGNITVTSYTVLTDAGHKILESQGTTTADVNDLDENHVNQTIVRSNGSARLTITDEQVTIDTHKFVKTAYSNGAYVKSSKVQVLTDGATKANQKYSYKLDFRKRYVGDGKADENKIKTIILYDEIEQYMNDASENSASVLNSKWQGTFEYADANECTGLRTDFTPTLWYRTTFDSSTWGDDFYGITRKNREEFSAMLRTLDPDQAGYNETELASAGWIKGKDIDASGRLYPQDADEGNVKVAVIVLRPRTPDQELENGKELNYFVTLHMIAPPAIVNDKSIVNTKALNMFFMEDTAFLVSDPDSCKASDDTEVLLANSLKIKKVDYNNTSFALAGYTDAHGEYKGAKFNVYKGSANSSAGGYIAPISFTNPVLQEYHDFDDSSYNEVPLLKKSVGINGVLELALPEGFYIIREVEAPEGYEIDDDYYLVRFKSDGKAELMAAYKGNAPDPDTGDVAGSITKIEQSEADTPKMDEDNAIISIKDKPHFKGEITFEKKVLQTGETLQGVEYQLREFEESGGYASVSVIQHKVNNVVQPGEYDYAKGETGVNMVTDANGKIVIHNLPAGYYSVLETSAPEGYLVDNGDKTFAITYETTKEGADEDSERIWIDTENGTTDEITGDTSYSEIYSLTDSQILSDISVTKTDTSSAPLKGASYTLYRYKNGSSMTAENAVRDIINNGTTGTGMTCFDEIASKTTSSSGTVTFSGLAFGTYYVRETSAPIGYRRSDDFNSSGDLTGRVIVIDSHGAATRYDADNGIKTPYRVSQQDEKKLGEVEINKTDTNGKALSGAKFRVFKLTDKPVGSDAHNTVLYDTTSYVSYVIAYSNKDNDWRRYDALDGTNAGTFETTDGKVKISGLDWGDDIEYCICEVSAPEGYEKTDPVMVSVTKFDVYNAQPIFISDEKVKGRATLTKTAKDDGLVQAGVEFQLYYRPMREADDEVTAYTPQKFTDNGSGSYTLDPEGSVSILVTNSSGQIKLDGLTWGDYYFKETKPLAGYKTAENITFSVNANSCLSNQQLSCEDEKGKAQITIDKVLKEDPYLYKDAFGEPTFIFKIRQIRSLSDHRDPETGAKVYTAYLNFDGLTAASDANKTRKTSPIDVEKGVYEISEISVSRYKPRGDVTTPSTVSSGTTITGEEISLDTTNHVVYCDLTGSGADDVPTYEARFDNEIMRYDKLSHTDNAENTFSAAEDYIVGFRLSYPSVIPINDTAATGVSTDLNKSDFVGYWRYRSGLEEAMTTTEREAVTYSLPSYSTGSWEPVDNGTTLTVENGTAVAGASYRENAAATKDGKTFNYEVTLNYASYTPPKIKYLTLYPDTGGYYTVTDNTTSENVGSALYKFSQQGSGDLVTESGSYTYTDGVTDPETHIIYLFSHWTRLNDDNEPVNPDTEKYTLEEVMDYVETHDDSAFRFRAQMREITGPTAMIIPSNVKTDNSNISGNAINWSSQKHMWKLKATAKTEEVYNQLFTEEYDSDWSNKWVDSGAGTSIRFFDEKGKDKTKIKGIVTLCCEDENRFKAAFLNSSINIYDVSVRFNNDFTPDSGNECTAKYNSSITAYNEYPDRIFAWAEPIPGKTDEYNFVLYTTSPGGIYVSDLDVQCANNYFDKWKGLLNIEGLEKFDTSKAKSLRGIFNYTQITNEQLNYIAGWDISNVKNAYEMFANTPITKIAPLAGWKPVQLCNINKMFNTTNQITDLSSINGWGNYFSNHDLGTNPTIGTEEWIKYTNLSATFSTQLSNWANPSHGRFSMTCSNNKNKLTVVWN